VRIFAREMKKLWNWKVLFAIAVFGALIWFAFLKDQVDGYESLQVHGVYGPYQAEMFQLYGETLEPEELADFDFPAKYAEISAAGNAIIAQEPLFAQYGITDFEEFYEWYTNESYWIRVGGDVPVVTEQAGNGALTITGQDDPEKEEKDKTVMYNALNGADAKTLDEWFAAPMMRWRSLSGLERRCVNWREDLDSWMQGRDLSPAVVRAAERIGAAGNNSLISHYLAWEFSINAAVTGVFALAAVMVLVAPPLITDRTRGIHLLQYASAVGRKIFRIQFAAAAVSAFILSAVITALSFAPFIAAAGEYWNAGIMVFSTYEMRLYNVTFGQYVWIFAGLIAALCTGAACLVFILARFSANIVSVMIKAVPAGVALSVAAALALTNMFSADNILFALVFRGRFELPEAAVCCAVMILGLAAAIAVTAREKRADVM
jgi:hypothetical protein